jgi:hypothetical protein
MKSKVNVKSLVLVGGLILAAIPSFAATTGTLFLSGVVAPRTEITVTADPNASHLPVGANVSGLAVASVNELSNNKAGYTVKLESANGWKLSESDARQIGTADSVPYALNYNNQAVDTSSASPIISNVSSRTPGSGTDKSLAISFSAAFLNADSYTDTLTFTIAAN